MNWHTWLTEKAMFGRVNMRYGRAPTTFLNLVISDKGSPSYRLRSLPLGAGVETSLQLTKFVLVNKSRIYFDYDKCTPLVDR